MSVVGPPVSIAKQGLSRERSTALKYCAVSLLGFAVDAAILRLGLAFGAPAWVRIISLICAMQVTFTVNGLMVFRTLTWRTLPRQWLSYMATNGFGNFCNYWIFAGRGASPEYSGSGLFVALDQLDLDRLAAHRLGRPGAA